MDGQAVKRAGITRIQAKPTAAGAMYFQAVKLAPAKVVAQKFEKKFQAGLPKDRQADVS